VVEAHFHFFVMVGVITLYQDWLPFGLALGHVVVHHGVLGVLAPAEVFGHPAAQHAPWKWALIHGAFVLAASVAYLVNWRLSERQPVEISRLGLRLEDAAAIVERLRAATPLVTCSVGPAAWDFPEASADLLARADQALYLAKAEGRNRHVLAS
jgi:hypothetical protein